MRCVVLPDRENSTVAFSLAIHDSCAAQTLKHLAAAARDGRELRPQPNLPAACAASRVGGSPSR
jgi:hypothetical protein